MSDSLKLKQEEPSLSQRERRVIQLSVARLSEGLGIIAALLLPFLTVFAIGLTFDKKTGGDPFYATTFYLFFLSPLWLLLGIFAANRTLMNKRIRRGVFIADAVLVVFLMVGIAIVRSSNAR